MIVVVGLVFSAYWQPRAKRGVLAYATSMSISDLLQATNQQRSNNSVASLALNAKLNQAAQAKANDMATRNYWSHNTPEGNPPWVFIDQAGYSYKTAGENLAYGFMTSGDTVAGWMNSPPHKENLLNGNFVDVGFGFANSSNYQSNGQQTIVVAMYGAPITTTAPAPVASSPSNSNQVAGESSPTMQPAPTTPITVEETTDKSADQQPPATSTPATLFKEPPSKQVSRLQTLTNGSIPWLASGVSIVMIAAIAAFVVRHSLALHRLLVRGERYVLHHMVFDVTIISLVGLCFIVSQSAGFIR